MGSSLFCFVLWKDRDACVHVSEGDVPVARVCMDGGEDEYLVPELQH